MSLKFAVEDIEAVDEAVRGFYSKGDDGKHYLDVEGAVSKRKLDEFRDNNVNLLKKLDSFKDVDVDEYIRLKDDALSGTKLTQKDVDKMVNDRVKSMKNEFDTKLSEKNKTIDTTNKQLESLLVDSAVRQASGTLGVLGSAMDDVVLRAKGVFKVENGVAVPYDSKGHVMYGKDGDSPMSANEWVKGLKKAAPHLFNVPAGAGASGQRTGGRMDTSKMSPLQKIQTAVNES